MFVQHRTMTLAAEIFTETPELRETAHRSETFKRLQERTRRFTLDAGTTYAVIEGDLLLDDDELHLYALQQAQRLDSALVSPITAAVLEPSPALVGISAGNRIVRWAPGRVLAYAVIRASFPSQAQYETVRDNIAAAAKAWEGTCGIEFNYAAEHDEHPDPAAAPPTIGPMLVFTVRHVDAGGQFIAAAFFPTYPPSRRRVLIDPSYFAGELSFDPTGVLRHELGHVLGFRHEHIRSGAPAVCPEEDPSGTIDLTAYDPQSVMHYFCGGVGSRDLRITDVDREGAQKLYGPPAKSLMLVE